jgi:hypothetical protein
VLLKNQHGVFLAMLLLGGCAVKRPMPPTWRITSRVLMPPGVAVEAALPRTIAVSAPGARGPCASNEAIAIVRKGSRVRATLNADALSRQAPGWLARWTADAEAKGCLPPSTGLPFAARVLEAVPLPSRQPYLLMHESVARSGFIELGPAYRLQVLRPILRAGATNPAPMAGEGTVTGTDASLIVTARASDDLIGVEMAWYAVRPSAIAPGYEIVPLSAERRIQGTTEPRPAPEVNLFAGARSGYFRLVYKGDQTEGVLNAPVRAALDAIDAQSCHTPGAEHCIPVPPLTGVNPYIAVQVNGAEIRVDPGSTLWSVIRAARRTPQDVMPTLAITKPFAGKQTPVEFDRAKEDVLGLVLLGDEVIRW